MFDKRYYYLIKIQYLGYRFHGWQKQPDVKTIHLMIDRTLKFILKDVRFKTLGAGRTDAMVSANEAALELFIYNEPILDFDAFLDLFNHKCKSLGRHLGGKRLLIRQFLILSEL